ncbi:glycosyltransferase [Nocardioides dokdonensis]|nr:glycosyltransferase [Nocardioides dokdonensis]
MTIWADLTQGHQQDAVKDLLTLGFQPLSNVLHNEGIHIVVLGRAPATPALVEAAEGLPCVFVDWVTDLQAALSSSDVILLPDTVGTGLKNRSIQALGSGACAVGTTVAFEGTDVLDGIHAVVRNAPHMLAESALALTVESHAHRAALSQAARKFVDANYSPEGVLDQWVELYREAMHLAEQYGQGSPPRQSVV